MLWMLRGVVLNRACRKVILLASHYYLVALTLLLLLMLPRVVFANPKLWRH